MWKKSLSSEFNSVHPDSTRQNNRIAALEVQFEPAALAVALSSDTRQRGL